MNNIKLVKILPHLIPLRVNEDRVAFYATTFTPQIYSHLEQLGFYEKKHITFSGLKSILQNYERVGIVNDFNQISVRGDTLTFWSPGYALPIRASFFDEELESLHLFDPTLSKKTRGLERIAVAKELLEDEVDIKSLVATDNLDTENLGIYSAFFPDFARQFDISEYDYVYPQLFWGRMDLFEKELGRLNSLGYRIEIDTKHPKDIPEQLHCYILDSDHAKKQIPAGYQSSSQKESCFTDREIFGTVYLTANSDASNSSRLLKQFEGEITLGTYVVHEDHGIAKYKGLTQEVANDQLQEYLHLEYAGDDELLVPVTQIKKLSKFIGMAGEEPKLSSLSRGTWDKERVKVKRSVVVLAQELVEHYARRELSKAAKIEAADTKSYLEFVEKFPYTETDDQIRAINEVMTDLESETPMNRLLIGDVGFGKTEVMIRAAFKMVEAGGQVAVLCPTTVLAAQHLAVFKDRFADTEYKVEGVSRFFTSKQNRLKVDDVNLGKVDIIIGTHRLLSNDIKFDNLGLLIVDEEQRFGVKQKEKIKQVNYGVHHLSVSATPIPRTLGMALSNIQDISVITSPPTGRKAIKTELIRDDWNRVVEVIQNEISVGGQVYFVHNRVQSIATVEAKLKNLLPGIKIGIAHGQMSPASLDKAMSDFYKRKFDILLATTIIENGLDLPNVNTIVINKAHMFGLSQLYQLRGRVGRSDRQAHCLLFYEGHDIDQELTQEQKKTTRLYLDRLKAIVDASELGAGFQVASKDLEIRGAGTLLGEKQSGHISKVGYVLYMQLLGDEIERLKEVKSMSHKPEYLTL